MEMCTPHSLINPSIIITIIIIIIITIIPGSVMNVRQETTAAANHFKGNSLDK